MRELDHTLFSQTRGFCNRIEASTNCSILMVLHKIVNTCFWAVYKDLYLADLTERLLQKFLEDEMRLQDVGLKHWCALLEEKRSNWISLVECLSGVVHRTDTASTDFLHPDDVRAAAEEAVKQRRSRQKRPGASGGAAGSQGRHADGSASAYAQAYGNPSQAPSAGNGAGQGGSNDGAPQDNLAQHDHSNNAAPTSNPAIPIFKRPSAKRVRIATGEKATKRNLDDVDGRTEMPSAKRAKLG